MNIRWETISPAPPPQPMAAEDTLSKSLSGSEALTHLLESAATANEPILLVVNDPHRSTQTRPALTALAKLTAGGVLGAGEHVRASPGHATRPPLARVPGFRAIVATGMHRFPNHERASFERATFKGCGLEIEDVTWHDASDARSLAQIGGVRMHRWVAESRFLLPIGSIEPHYFAGVTGAHKTITVGCMSAEDIERNHAGALSPSSDVLRLQGNPVFDGIVEILRRLESEGKTICAIGQVVCGEAMLAAEAGDPVEMIDALLPLVCRTYLQGIAQPVDVLRLRVPQPLGRNLYQADKALKNNHLAVRDGGGIILEADCAEGIGPDSFLNLLRRSDDYATAQRIVVEEGYRLGDHKAVKLRHLMDPACRGVRVVLVSPHISDSDLQGTGIEAFRRVEPALERFGGELPGSLNHGLIVEDAGMASVTPLCFSP